MSRRALDSSKRMKAGMFSCITAPSRRVRTPDIQIRSLTLYPAEPWARIFFFNGGESGIRTRGTPLKGVQSLSRRSLSATQPSLRDLFPARFLQPWPAGHNLWRREQDSNPRTFRSTVFKTAAIEHSALPPHVC